MAALARRLTFCHPRMRQEPGWPRGHGNALRLIFPVQLLHRRKVGPGKLPDLLGTPGLWKEKNKSSRQGQGVCGFEGHWWERGRVSEAWKELISPKQKGQGQVQSHVAISW